MTKKNDNCLLDSNSSLTSAFNDEVANRVEGFLTSAERTNKEVSCDEYSDNDNNMGSLWEADLIVDAVNYQSCCPQLHRSIGFKMQI